MEKVVCEILDALREGDLDEAALDRIIRSRSKQAHDGRRVFAKKRILPYYLSAKREGGALWESWQVDDDLDLRFVRTLQMKPRRTASGVATITVITKPWPCANSCVYCPNDARMPKSYLSDEPACQRAARTGFHPYLQVASRLRTLQQMGHDTGKVELIVLGGTWLDYPADYRIWFVAELFAALNDTDGDREAALDSHTRDASLKSEAHEGPGRWLATPQGDAGFRSKYRFDDAAVLDELHAENETSEHRVVGLVVETRPDTITIEALRELRKLGCTKIQMGVQSIDDRMLALNGRKEDASIIKRAFELSRLFGFKTHAHFMLNLLGATPDSDIRDFRMFANSPEFSPDEVKLYPCALVAGTELVERYECGSWHPYSEQELVTILCEDMIAVPPYMRVSRMIRDISAKDILAGNKKTNLRQMVDEELRRRSVSIDEIRFREIGTDEVRIDKLVLDEVRYETTATDEIFLQWLTPEGRIVGFLRLSLPRRDAFKRYSGLPTNPDEAMIREVHVYGFATAVDARGASAQHHGLGAKLINRAFEIASESGYCFVNVISAVGTRSYYRRLGFIDNGLYQRKAL